MNIGELFKLLSYGEFSNLTLGNDGQGTIREDKKEMVVAHTQQALKALYSRFAHKIDYVTLRQSTGIKKYAITKIHAVTDETAGNNADRYLIDIVADPFIGDIVKIRSVRGIDSEGNISDKDVLINENTLAPKVKTLAYDTLYFQEPIGGSEFLIEYQCNHPLLDPAANMEDEIILAPILESALTQKIASRVYRSMNGAENLAKSQLLEAGYEAACNMVQWEDLLQLSSSYEGNSFTDGGWA